MLDDDVTVGVSVTGALTPAGLGMSCLIPLIEAGFVDWIVSTGANLYHDTHFGIGLSMHRGRPDLDDVALREDEVVRIYDIVFDYKVLLDTDAFYRKILFAPQFQREMGTAEFHYLIGQVRRASGRRRSASRGARCSPPRYEYGVPIYTSSPGDSSIGMNVAALALEGSKLEFDVSRDVNETAAIVLDAKRTGGKSGVLILGGGSPKNFVLQTEPQMQEVLGIEEKGHDYFLQFTDARADTGGLSGATPSEAVSWGKVDPDKLPDTVVCYCDSTIALPILTAYALANHTPRKPKRLYERRERADGAAWCASTATAHVYGPDGGFKPRAMSDLGARARRRGRTPRARPAPSSAATTSSAIAGAARRRPDNPVTQGRPRGQRVHPDALVARRLPRRRLALRGDRRLARAARAAARLDRRSARRHQGVHRSTSPSSASASRSSRTGGPVVGVEYNPAADELFAAVRGAGHDAQRRAGAGQHDERASPTPSCSRAAPRTSAASGTPSSRAARRLTGSVAYKLASSSTGDGDATFTLTPKNEWDICAGTLLVEEAGGRVTDLDGRAARLQPAVDRSGPG